MIYKMMFIRDIIGRAQIQGAILGIALCMLFSGCKDKSYKAYVDRVEGLPEKVDFNFHIRPILSDRCFSCHGPDENSRSTDFRLDTKEGAFAALKESKGERAIVPGDPSESEIFRRITSEDPDYRMPTPESHLDLTDREVALITKWIEQGAEWKNHWSFLPIEEQNVPKVKNSGWPVNDIDRFVLNRLEQEQMVPSPEAPKEKLIRRVSFDLKVANSTVAGTNINGKSKSRVISFSLCEREVGTGCSR